MYKILYYYLFIDKKKKTKILDLFVKPIFFSGKRVLFSKKYKMVVLYGQGTQWWYLLFVCALWCMLNSVCGCVIGNEFK
jgi:hypothetical protein